ncbi:MAG: hypothetical protein PHE17_14865 [Thiothrix sp.]|uniref:hypothetical protein n=1 Tax=Thiothrix sp. TaxID=1032 RepID=UPI002633B96F|nr:hypothetical protein [Thiothrix sp.]MDD5394293.1 hypothetical protein [Thiothrix sp.]
MKTKPVGIPMKPSKTVLFTGLLLAWLGSQTSYAVDSQALGDALTRPKPKKTNSTTQSAAPRPSTTAGNPRPPPSGGGK